MPCSAANALKISERQQREKASSVESPVVVCGQGPLHERGVDPAAVLVPDAVQPAGGCEAETLCNAVEATLPVSAMIAII
ncbi:hypothetical protein GCM10020216_013860 [Nonomuraea helvata]